MATKVLVIAGVAHCGSTFLGKVLGQVDGVFYAGGVHLTATSLERDWACGCGEQHRSCPLWQPVYRRAFVDTGGPELLRLDHRDERALALARPWRLDASRLAPQRAAFARLYAALPVETGARVVVDSSKAPGYARFLRSVEGVEVYVLHLVRDPRATVHSWRREQAGRSSGPRFRPLSVAAIWGVWNVALELAFGRRTRYLRIRHEDLVADPRGTLERVLGFVGEGSVELPLSDERHVRVELTHTIAGNPNRSEQGEIAVRRDDSWRGRGGGRAVSLLTWPLRRRYGY